MSSAAPDLPVIDLHTHTSCSDGTQTPAELVRAAAEANVRVLGLTDHDVLAGWAQADVAGREQDVTVVPGVELSTQVAGVSVHLLAYFVDPLDRSLNELMTSIRAHRESRFERTVQLLAADGYPVDAAAIMAHVGAGVTLGRPHVADALVRAGAFADRDAVFASVLHGSSRYYVRHWAPSALESIQMVRAAGGVPIMAHPFARARGRTVSDAQIADLVDAGLAGFEVDHPDHDAADRLHARQLQTRLAVIGTGSSDFHGTGKTTRLAECTTDTVELERIREQGTGTGLLGADINRISGAPR